MSMSWNHAGGGQTGTMGIEYLDGLYSYALVLTRNRSEVALRALAGHEAKLHQPARRIVDKHQKRAGLPVSVRDGSLVNHCEQLSFDELLYAIRARNTELHWG
jgi:hypothetical protein